jgi:hypothetical protein
MQSSSEGNLLDADESILAFLRTVDSQRCRLIVSGHEISGLVSLSDLQRLPVRAALFGMITYLEMLMSKVIRAEFDQTEAWIDRITEGRREKIDKEISKARAGDSLVDTLLFTQFADKATIIRRNPHFPFGQNRFKNVLSQIQSLRDDLVHANDYAASSEAACKVCSTVRLIDKWNKDLSDWMRTLEKNRPARAVSGDQQP